MTKKYHHFEVTKDAEVYQIVVEGALSNAEKEIQGTFKFDSIKYLKTSGARLKDYHGNRRIGDCVIRGFWQKFKRSKADDST